MKTLSTLFIAAAFALSMIACGGSDAEAAESQSDETMTTGDEMGTDDTYGAEEESLEETPVEEGMDEGAEEGADEAGDDAI